MYYAVVADELLWGMCVELLLLLCCDAKRTIFSLCFSHFQFHCCFYCLPQDKYLKLLFFLLSFVCMCGIYVCVIVHLQAMSFIVTF